MRSGFARLHPLVNLTFFVLVLAFAMFLSHPAVQLAGLVCAALFALRCTGRGFGRRMAMLLPLMLLAAVVNPLVSHQGVTVLFRFPSGNACKMCIRDRDVVYSLVPTDSDIPMAQVCYVSSGISYTARSLKTDSAADLTGSSANWTQELSWSDAGLAMDLRTDGEESWVGWYAGSTGTQWALGAEDSAQSVLHSACGILKTLGYDVAVAPEDAENVTYSVLEIDGQTVAETAFTLDGIPYRWHVGTGDSEDPERLVDLSGSERVYPHTEETTIRWCRAELSDDPGNAGCKLIWICLLYTSRCV